MNEVLSNNARFQVGDIEIISLNDAILTLPAQQMFPSVSESEWGDFYNACPNAFQDIETWTPRISCNFIDTPDQLIFIDTGVGPSSTAFAQFIRADGKLSQQMQKEGIAPADVDVVFLTHLHGDHVGWNTPAEDQHPTFSNARYLASRKDWDFCQYRLENGPQKAGYIHENIFPLLKQQRLEFIEEEITLTNGVKAFFTPGHTPGHMSIKIEGENGQKAWLLGDVAAHPLQITEPAHRYIFDHDPEAAIQTRSKLLEQIDTEGGIVGACHFPQPGFERLAYQQNKRYWQPVE